MAEKQPTSFTLSDEARELLAELASKLGLSMSARLEILIRKEAAEVKKEKS